MPWLPQPDYGLPAGITELNIEGAPSVAYDINDRGQVLMAASSPDNPETLPYLWQAGGAGIHGSGFRLIGNRENERTTLSHLSNSGQAAGFVSRPGDRSLAVIWQDDQYLVPEQLSPEPLELQQIAASNDSGMLLARSVSTSYLLISSDFQEPTTAALVFPWVAVNDGFTSTLAVDNLSAENRYLSFVATRPDGSTARANRIIPAAGQWVESAESLFAALGKGPGYSVTLLCEKGPLYGSSLLFGRTPAWGLSPSQINASAPDQASPILLYSLVVNDQDGATSGLTATNMGDTTATVRFHAWQNGSDRGFFEVNIPPGRPFAKTFREMFPDLTGHAYVISQGDQPLVGACFMFNAWREPATTAAIPLGSMPQIK